MTIINAYQKVWIRIAGNSPRMKQGTPPFWRYSVQGQADYYQLASWEGRGDITLNNHRQGVNPDATGSEFIAWVEYYGDMTVDDTLHAVITLCNPLK